MNLREYNSVLKRLWLR